MESLDILILGVEASFALAGFAGIIATFQFGDGKAVRRGDAAGLSVIVQFSLLSGLGCSIPLLLYSFGMKEATLWTISSVVGAILFLGGGSVMLRNMWGVRGRSSFQWFNLSALAISFLCLLVHVMNIFGIVFHREAGPTILGAVWALSLSGYMFYRLLLRPIWRSVRHQEAEKLGAAASI